MPAQLLPAAAAGARTHGPRAAPQPTLRPVAATARPALQDCHGLRGVRRMPRAARTAWRARFASLDLPAAGCYLPFRLRAPGATGRAAPGGHRPARPDAVLGGPRRVLPYHLPTGSLTVGRLPGVKSSKGQ